MKKSVLILAACGLMMCACNQTKTEDNPFFSEFKTEQGVPPFNLIQTNHYEPAFIKGMEEQNNNIKAIIDNKAKPNFENTIVALDNSDPILSRVIGVFFNLTEAETTKELTDLSMKLSPMLSKHSDNIQLNQELFKKVAQVYKERESLSLNQEQNRLLEETYKGFVRAGANLNAKDQEKLKEINSKLSTLGIQFSNNVLNDNNKFKLFISDKKDLTGLPEGLINAAAAEAKANGKEGQWMFSLQSSSRIPFLQYAQNRELRKQVYTAYINKGNHNDANDNKKIITELLSLRLEKAKLLGFDNYSNFVLDNTMAKDSKTVMSFLDNLWGYALPKAKAEAKELTKMLHKDGIKGKLMPWDWWYYTEKIRKEKFNLSEDQIKPYFKLENVREGAFKVANKLYGITLKERTDIPTYHPDVKAFQVNDKDGSLLGIFYVDYFPRSGKRGGAWMNNYRDQQEGVRPIICNVASFTKPVGDTPSLLTLDEVETLFHEFGHALHGLLTQCHYKGVSGTSVKRDFVELPSQVMEHWATEPEVLKMYAKHYKTGETIPQELVDKILKQGSFNQGFISTELMAAAILDMSLHNLTSFKDFDVLKFEKEVMDKYGLIPEIAPRYRTTYFNHIIGGYAAGYYSYLWANVLDCDAFEAFKENGIFDQTTAKKFRENVLEKGNTQDPMELYKQFRGSEPKLEPMLKSRGLI